MNIFEFDRYQTYISDSIKSLPKGGRGELRKLALHVGIHTSTLSQILKGTKNFTMEQACLVAEFMGLNEVEGDYLVLLVMKERAGTKLLQQKLERQLNQLKQNAKDLKNMLPVDSELTMESKAIFYSNWHYTAAWALTSIPRFRSPESLQRYFQLPKIKMKEIIGFLLRSGLLVESKGEFSPGQNYVHLDSSSPLLPRHHANWRIKAMEKHPGYKREDLSYTSPMTISEKDAERIRELLVEMIKKINAIRGPSDCETFYCLNLDWFGLLD